MSSDFSFTATSWFLGNVLVKPYFNTQCPLDFGRSRSKICSVERPWITNRPPPAIRFSDLPTALLHIPAGKLQATTDHIVNGNENTYLANKMKSRKMSYFLFFPSKRRTLPGRTQVGEIFFKVKVVFSNLRPSLIPKYVIGKIRSFVT